MITAALTAFAGLSLRTRIESIAVVAVVAGAGIWWLTRTPPPVPEVITAAPQVVQADQSVIAQRAPDAHPPPAPHMLPKGSVEVRRVQGTVAPSPAAAASGCPPVRFDLSIVRIDGGQRAIVSSPDGTVMDAKDIPIEAAMLPPQPKLWAAGLSYSTQREVGVWLERDVGRLRVGVEVAKGIGAPRAEVRLGVAF